MHDFPKLLVSVALCAFAGPASALTDCDGNGVDDAIQIANDPSLDCDGDGVLNSCESAPLAANYVVDVNHSGSVSIWVGEHSTATNGFLASVEVTSNPIQGFTYPQVGQVEPGTFVQFQHSGFIPPPGCDVSIDTFTYVVRDTCGGVSAPATITLRVQHPTPDCDCDFRNDYDELLSGSAIDSDGNGVLDQCQAPSPCRISAIDKLEPIYGDGTDPDVTPDGRFVAYVKRQFGFPSTDRIYVFDRTLWTTEEVTVTLGGAPNGASRQPSISDDGRYVAFTSDATNLVASDTNGWSDVFVRDLLLDSTRRISVTNTYAQSNGPSDSPSISGDGRFVAFRTNAANISLGFNPTESRLHLFDLHAVAPANPLERITHVGETTANGPSYAPSVSYDGRYVAFETDSTNLVAPDTNGTTDVLRYDRLAPYGFWMTRLSSSSAGTQANDRSYAPSISSNGLVVAFLSDATNLVPGDTNQVTDAFVHETSAATTIRVSDGLGGQANGPTFDVRIDPTGRDVLFVSGATNLVSAPPDANGSADVFVRDLVDGSLELVSVGDVGAVGDWGSGLGGADLSANTRVVAFSSFSTNFIPFDVAAQDSNVFVRTCQPIVYPSVCAGDGSGTACPCGNVGAPGHGCAHSVDAAGALLSTSGIASLSWDDLTLHATQTSNAAWVTFLQGTTLESGGAGSVFGDGLRCAGGTVIRLGTIPNIAGSASYPSGGAAAISVRGGLQGPTSVYGAVRYYQAWFRNSASFCTPAVFNLSNAVRVAWLY